MLVSITAGTGGSVFFVILAPVAWVVGFGALTGWLSRMKGRSALGGAVLGMFFGILAALVVWFAPSRRTRSVDRFQDAAPG